MNDILQEESERATQLLKDKVVKFIQRIRDGEVLIEFTDGTRFFIDRVDEGLELSIT